MRIDNLKFTAFRHRRYRRVGGAIAEPTVSETARRRWVPLSLHPPCDVLTVRSQSGFTLLETLVAMILLSVSLVIVLQLFSGGLRSGGLSDDYTRAVFHAREKMEETLIAEALSVGEWNGKFEDGFAWRVDIVLREDDEDLAEKTTGLFKITVGISWMDGGTEREVDISTLKIAAIPQSAEDA